MWLSQSGTGNNYRNVHLGLARKEHGRIIEMQIVMRILAKIKSRVIVLAAWRKN